MTRKPRARVVDTSVLIAASRPNDPNHAKALQWMSEPGPAVVPNEVVIETLGVVRSHVGREAALQLLLALRGTEGIELGHETELASALALRDAKPGLSLVDAVGITVAWRLGCDLDTLDETQRTVWKRRPSA